MKFYILNQQRLNYWNTQNTDVPEKMANPRHPVDDTVPEMGNKQ